MACEQTFLNAAPFITNADRGAAAAGAVVTVMVIARAPMQLFQSVSTSLLPHLSKLRAADDFKTYRHSVRVTLAAIAGFSSAVAVVMALIGPWIMTLLFTDKYDYHRVGLVAITLGMGIYLCAATLNQTALAARRVKAAVACWLGATAVFVVWMLLPVVSDPLHRVEIGYPMAALILFLALLVLYQKTTPRSNVAVEA